MSRLKLLFLNILLCISLPLLAGFEEDLARLESTTGGRLGVSALNTTNNQSLQYRADETFPMGSTYKVIVAGALLKRAMTDSSIMEQKIRITKADLSSWSPATEKHVNKEITVPELASMMLSHSDNTAAILLVKKLGGAEAIISFARSIGDSSYSMNSEGNFQYTTSPSAMEKSLKELTLGSNTLSPPQRTQLIAWLKANTTGDLRIRAGVPKGWVVADKTGTGDFGTTNDIAIIWPPNASPIVIAIYYTHAKEEASRQPQLLAEVTRIVLKELSRNIALD